MKEISQVRDMFKDILMRAESTYEPDKGDYFYPVKISKAGMENFVEVSEKVEAILNATEGKVISPTDCKKCIHYDVCGFRNGELQLPYPYIEVEVKCSRFIKN